MEQLDLAFSKVLQDPKKNVINNLKEKYGLLSTPDVINNLKKKHGLVVSPPSGPSINRKQCELFDQQQLREKINVESFRQKMSRATLLDNNSDYPIMRSEAKNAFPRRRHSMILADDLAVIGQKMPPKPEITVDPSPNQRRRLPQVPQKGIAYLIIFPTWQLALNQL